jgi:hypothetical protein
MKVATTPRDGSLSRLCFHLAEDSTIIIDVYFAARNLSND